MIATRGLGAGFGALPSFGMGAGYGGAPPDVPDEVSAPNYWTSGWDVRMPDEEIIFLRRKTSSKTGV